MHLPEVSHAVSKLINALKTKKGRRTNGLFMAEGFKTVSEFQSAGYVAKIVLLGPENRLERPTFAGNPQFYSSTAQKLSQLSTLTTNQDCLALFPLPEAPTELPKNACRVVYLDHIQDPGNLGTIIRTCDWYKVDALICSKDTTDPWSPKVVTSTKGSLARLPILSVDRSLIVTKLDGKIPLYGADMDGSTNVEALPEKFCLIMGNESKGISAELRGHLDKTIAIPRFNPQSESLNVAISTAILLDRLIR